MKSLWHKLKRKYMQMPMQKKMLLSYALPMILIVALIGILIVPRVQKNQEQQLAKHAGQSLLQAENFLEQHVANFYYIEELLEKHESFTEYISLPDEGMSDAEAYRKTLGIILVLEELEASYNDYHISLYFDQELQWWGNSYYTRLKEELTRLPDWEEIEEAIDGNHFCFLNMMDASRTQESVQIPYLVMFRKMSLRMSDGSMKEIIVKVELRSQYFREILKNAGETADAITFLTNKKGVLIASEDGWKSGEDTGKDSEFYRQIDVKDWSLVELDGKEYISLKTDIKRVDWTLHTLIPRAAFQAESRMLSRVLVIVLGILCILVFLVSELLALSFGKRLTVLNDSIRELRGGDLMTHIQTEDMPAEDEIEEIYHSFNEMTEEIQHLLKEHYELGKKVTRTELEALQAQIKPHFLYNTLDLINWGAMDYGAEDIARIARDLGQFYRMSLNHGQPVIRIANELKLVSSYVNIENVHFDGMIDLVIDVSDEIKEYGCLNLVLQPLVENAIVHGIAEHPELIFCTIRISARQEGSDIILCVEDDGPGIPEEKLAHLLDYDDQAHTDARKGGYGVKNINFRHKLIFGDSYGVSYESKVGEGTRAYIRIPAMSCEEMSRL